MAHSKPPPTLTVKVVQLKEKSQLSKYEISNGILLPETVHKNIIAATTDGTTAWKVVLYENLAFKITTGECYAIADYKMSTFSPNTILLQENTRIYESLPLSVSSESEEEARQLLSPATTQMAIKDLHPEIEQLLSISGFVKSVSFS